MFAGTAPVNARTARLTNLSSDVAKKSGEGPLSGGGDPLTGFFNTAAFIGVGVGWYPTFYSLAFVAIGTWGAFTTYGVAAILIGLACILLALIFGVFGVAIFSAMRASLRRGYTVDRRGWSSHPPIFWGGGGGGGGGVPEVVTA